MRSCGSSAGVCEQTPQRDLKPVCFNSLIIPLRLYLDRISIGAEPDPHRIKDVL